MTKPAVTNRWDILDPDLWAFAYAIMAWLKGPETGKQAVSNWDEVRRTAEIVGQRLEPRAGGSS